MQSENLKIGSGYALICMLWGSTWLAIRFGLDSLTPIFSAGLRFGLAAIFFLVIMKIKKVKLQTDPLSIKLYLIMGFFSFVIPFGLVYWAEQYIASGLTSVLFAIFPFWVIIFSRIAMPKETIGPHKITGVILGFIGIYVIFSDKISMNLSDDIWGMIAIITSAIMQAGVAVIIKKHGRELNPLSMNLVPVIIAGAAMIAIGLTFEDMQNVKFDDKAIFSVIYLALFGTVFTFTTYYWLMKKINVVILSLSSFITPIVAVFLGWFIRSEVFSIEDLMGSALVLMGILFANFRGLYNYYKLKTKHA